MTGHPDLEYSDVEEDPVLLGSFRHAITRYRLMVYVYRLRLAEARTHGCENTVDVSKPQFQSGEFAKSIPPVLNSMRAGFLSIPSPNHPISNLVAKSLRLAANSSV